MIITYVYDNKQTYFLFDLFQHAVALSGDAEPQKNSMCNVEKIDILKIIVLTLIFASQAEGQRQWGWNLRNEMHLSGQHEVGIIHFSNKIMYIYFF